MVVPQQGQARGEIPGEVYRFDNRVEIVPTYQVS